MDPTMSSPHPSPSTVRNRRYRRMQQLVVEGDFFSIENMRIRHPLLYQQYMGSKFFAPASASSTSAMDGSNMADRLLHAYDLYEADLKTKKGPTRKADQLMTNTLASAFSPLPVPSHAASMALPFEAGKSHFGSQYEEKESEKRMEEQRNSSKLREIEVMKASSAAKSAGLSVSHSKITFAMGSGKASASSHLKAVSSSIAPRKVEEKAVPESIDEEDEEEEEEGSEEDPIERERDKLMMDDASRHHLPHSTFPSQRKSLITAIKSTTKPLMSQKLESMAVEGEEPKKESKVVFRPEDGEEEESPVSPMAELSSGIQKMPYEEKAEEETEETVMRAAEDVMTQEECEQQFLLAMQARFLRGEDSEYFDDTSCDFDSSLDDIQQEERDAEDRFFDSIEAEEELPASLPPQSSDAAVSMDSEELEDWEKDIF